MILAEQLRHTPPLAEAPESCGGHDGPGRILARVFETFEKAGIRYCVLHGYEQYPERVGSDVDCVVDDTVSPSELFSLLEDNKTRIGAGVVRCRGRYIVLGGKGAGGPPCFLALDLTTDCELDGLPFYAGSEVLESRRRHDGFWIPAPSLAFGCYLTRTVAKGVLEEERLWRLSSLFQHDPPGCAQQVARFWSPGSAELIISAAASGDWQPVRRRLNRLRAELRRRAILGRPRQFLRNRIVGLGQRLRRVWRPEGLSIVLLGPDGAGKSSVVEALGPRLADVFTRSTCWGFAPPIRDVLFRPRATRTTDQPHALPSRSYFASLLRAAYWGVYHTLSYPKLRWALARSTLVIHDRHFVDIFVDPRRYRYGGPPWLLRLIWRSMPKPDLIVLLDAPAEVLQARKQEVPIEETARQRSAYLSLVRTIGNGHVVDVSRSLNHVIDDVSEIIIRHLAMRAAKASRGRGDFVRVPRPDTGTLPLWRSLIDS